MAVAMRIVHDTNVVLSALLFGGKAAQLRAHWRSGAIIPVVCKQTMAELLLALRYPKFKLTAADTACLLEDYLPYAQVLTLSDERADDNALPKCRDSKDQVFLELAHHAKAFCLLTGDADLLVLRQTSQNQIALNQTALNFTILTLAELLSQHFITPKA